MIKRLFVLMCLVAPCTTYAAPHDERPGVCYMFKGDKLLSKGTCVVATGGGAGGVYETMTYKGKDYIAETALCFDKKSDEYVTCGTNLNGLDADYYHRDLFYNIVDREEGGVLSCYASKKIDICYK